MSNLSPVKITSAVKFAENDTVFDQPKESKESQDE